MELQPGKIIEARPYLQPEGQELVDLVWLTDGWEIRLHAPKEPLQPSQLQDYIGTNFLDYP